MEKNQEYIVDIIDNGFEGEGIAKIEGKPVFIKGAIQGEQCRIVITKVLTQQSAANTAVNANCLERDIERRLVVFFIIASLFLVPYSVADKASKTSSLFYEVIILFSSPKEYRKYL